MKRGIHTMEEKAGWFSGYLGIQHDVIQKKVDSQKLSKYGEDGKWNLEKKFRPYKGKGRKTKKREELFSKDGSPNFKPPSILESQIIIKRFKDSHITLNEYKKVTENLRIKIENKNKEIEKFQKLFNEYKKVTENQNNDSLHELE